MQILAENDRGWLALDGNELIVGSKVYDPPKLRGTAPVNQDGGGGFAISANLSRHAGVAIDGHDMVEMAMLRWEQAQDVRGQVGNPKCEANFMVNDGGGDGDSNMMKPLAFCWNAVTCIGTAFAAGLRAALGGIPSSDGPTGRFYSGNGLYVWNYQDDGSVVFYETHGSRDETTWTPKWAQRPSGLFETF